MSRALRDPIRTAVATMLVLRAAARVAWLEPRHELADLVSHLKAVPPSVVELDGSVVDGVVEKLLPLLPPWGAGRCVKRSLMLLDLRSREGLDARLHLGFVGVGPARDGHAWVSIDGETPPGVRETWHS